MLKKPKTRKKATSNTCKKEKPIKEEIKRNKKTGHPSLTFSKTKRRTKAIGFTHDDDETHGKKYKMKKNINPKDKTQMFAKVNLENEKSSTYKTEPKYKHYRVAKEDRTAIDKIKKGKYK